MDWPAIRGGAEDVESGEESHIVCAADTDLNEVVTALRASRGERLSTKHGLAPRHGRRLGLEERRKLMKLIDALGMTTTCGP